MTSFNFHIFPTLCTHNPLKWPKILYFKNHQAGCEISQCIFRSASSYRDSTCLSVSLSFRDQKVTEQLEPACKCTRMQEYNQSHMIVCMYASMQVCKYASMQVCKYASLQVCKYASLQVCTYIQVCKYTCMQVYTGVYKKLNKKKENHR